MSNCPTCEHQDTVDLIDLLLIAVNNGSLDRFKAACLDPAQTVMFNHERTAIVELVNTLLETRRMLPLLTEITKKKMELRKNAGQN